MKVYLVMEDNEVSAEVVGVYASKSSAEAHADAIMAGTNWPWADVVEVEVRP